jgi:hypothetical protein
MKTASSLSLFVAATAILLSPRTAAAQQPLFNVSDIAGEQRQQNPPAKVNDAEDTVERDVKKFGIGVEAGVGLDPEIIDLGAHATFGPVFNRNVSFRPGLEFGFGEVTTTFGINLDFLYTLPGAARGTRWTPYVGTGPNFGLSHRSFQATTDTSRFDFSDTSFDAGLNFIAGARSRSGMFLEMRATAYGISNVRLLAGFNF